MASKERGQQQSANDENDVRYLLERLLARTSLASEGQDQALDSVLSGLRQYLRGQERSPASLKGFLARLDDELERLDSQSTGDSREAGRVLSELLASVENREAFADAASELKRLRRELGPQGLARDQWLPWLEAFTRIAGQALDRTNPGQGRERGLLGRMFGRRDDSTDTAGEAGELDLGHQVPAAGAVEDGQRVRIARRVGELMDRLMQQVDLPPDSHKRALSLKSRLSEQQDWDLLRQSLEETADLVIAVVTHSQREFEHFLQRLDERLSSLQGHFSEHVDTLTARHSAAARMEESVQADLTELGGSLQASTSLGELRASVTHHIERISRTVEAFRHQEDERGQQVMDQMGAMREKLVAMETHCEQVRTQLEQERARALTDTLTQLPNREAWDERLRFEYQRWQRYGRPLALAVIDIDHFKRVNDSFGHKAGDRVIQLVAKALKERLRATDFVARYGGEEFVVVMPETSPEQALGVMEGLRGHVAGMPFHFQGQPVRVTVSAGLSGLREDVTPEVAFDEADRALYTAKSSGRDRVEVAVELGLQ